MIGVENKEYRVVITGQLLPGHDRASAQKGLAGIFDVPEGTLGLLFDGGQHPIEERLSAEQALDLQNQLEGVGVDSRIERLASQGLDLKLRRSDAVAVAQEEYLQPLDQTPERIIRCPSCGYEQIETERCASCGTNFATYQQRYSRDSSRPPVDHLLHEPAPAAARTHQAAPAAPLEPPAPPELDNSWRDAWGELEDDVELDESAYMSLFFGPNAERHMDRCDRMMKGPRTMFRAGWVWSAVISPFFWVMYRKMWALGLVVFVTEILLPMLAIILGSYGIVDSSFVLIGYLGMLLNRMFWPAVLPYLYCRYSRQTIRQLHMLSPNYATEIDIATAGGVSSGSVAVGVVLSAVLGVFLWSTVDSISQSNHMARQNRVLEAIDGRDADAEQRESVANVVGIDAQNMSANKKPVSKWGQTREGLRKLGGHIDLWLDQHPGKESAQQLNMFRLREEMSVPPEDLMDAWSNEIQYLPEVDGYRVVSAGPDRLFGTADDIQFRRNRTQ